MHQIENNIALLEEDDAMSQPILTFNSRKRMRYDDLTFNESDCIRILSNGEYPCDIPCPDHASYSILSQHRTRSRVAMEHQDALARIEQIYKIIMETNCITSEIRSRLNQHISYWTNRRKFLDKELKLLHALEDLRLKEAKDIKHF